MMTWISDENENTPPFKKKKNIENECRELWKERRNCIQFALYYQNKIEKFFELRRGVWTEDFAERLFFCRHKTLSHSLLWQFLWYRINTKFLLPHLSISLLALHCVLVKDSLNLIFHKEYIISYINVWFIILLWTTFTWDSPPFISITCLNEPEIFFSSTIQSTISPTFFSFLFFFFFLSTWSTFYEIQFEFDYNTNTQDFFNLFTLISSFSRHFHLCQALSIFIIFFKFTD
jgi:hypothetical protein